MSVDRPAHLISPDEVDTWLADSAVRAVTYHRTTSWAARSIVKRGVDIRLSRIGAYGQGFYTSTRTPDDQLGDVTLTVAVRLQHSLIGSQERIEGVIDDLIIERYGSFRPITPTVAEAIRRQFIRLSMMDW